MDLDPDTAEELFDDDRETPIDDVSVEPHVKVETDPTGYSARITFGDDRKTYELTTEDRIDLLDELSERENLDDDISMWDVISYPVTTIEILDRGRG